MKEGDEGWLDFKAIKEKADARAVLSQFGLLEHLEERGAELTGWCPFGDEHGKKDSFSMNVEKKRSNVSRASRGEVCLISSPSFKISICVKRRNGWLQWAAARFGMKRAAGVRMGKVREKVSRVSMWRNRAGIFQP